MRPVFLALLLCLLVGQATAATQTPLFNKALDAIQAQDWAKLATLKDKLGDNYGLAVYLEYHQLKQLLPDASPKQINTFREVYKDTPPSSWIYGIAMRSYANNNRWDDLLELVKTPPNSTSLRCDYNQALLQTGKGDSAKITQSLVDRNAYMPSSCRELLGYLHRHRQLHQPQMLTLMRHAFRHEQGQWMREVAAWLPAGVGEKQWLLKLYKHPDTLTVIPKSFSTTIHQRLFALALHRLVPKDREKALQVWQSAPASVYSKGTKRRLAARIAWYSAISSEKANRKWLDAWLNQHPEATSTLDQRTRRAVIEQDWKGLLHWVALMPSAEQHSTRWQYWRGRAYQQLGDKKQAVALWKQAADERTFYGFLAADRLGQPFQLNAAGNQHGQLHLTAANQHTMARARLLLQTGHAANARREWYYLLKNTDAANFSGLAHFALAKKWYRFAIMTANTGDGHNRMDWRFPLAYLQDFKQAAKRVKRADTFLLMAVARRESAFGPMADSRVGARGLMQLMPATAQGVAQRLGMTITNEDLYDPAINLTLGSSYLSGLLEDYHDNWLLTLAAYNAGPSNVERWLSRGAKPYDVWIASIGYHETRSYVKAVLAYRVIFMKQAGVPDDEIHLIRPAAKQFVYTNKALGTALVMNVP